MISGSSRWPCAAGVPLILSRRGINVVTPPFSTSLILLCALYIIINMNYQSEKSF